MQAARQSQVRKDFNELGYHVAKGVLSTALLQTIREEMHEIIGLQLQHLGLRRSAETNLKSMHNDFTKLYQVDRNRYLASLRLCAKLASVYRFYLGADMLAVASDLGIDLPVFQTQPVLHLMAESLRIKDGYFGVGVHQDWPALQSGLDTLTVWIPLFPVRKNGYTLEVIPGTHAQGLVEATEQQHIHEVAPRVYEKLSFQSVEIDAGDAFFFSTFLIHKSELTGADDAFRVAFSMRYENAKEPTFIRRSFPTAQKRVVERTLAPEDVPSAESVAAIYDRT